jgi:proteasome lid subunit RPN8/RPN11
VITLELRHQKGPSEFDTANTPPVSLTSIENRLNSVLLDLSSALQQAKQSTVLVPSELLYQAVHQLCPAERMGVMPVRSIMGRTVLGSLHDVTGVGQPVHVRADPARLAAALIGFERAGAALGGWIHSHPGLGPGATMPSNIDRAQYADWLHDYSQRLIGLIVVADGFVRFWGDAVESGSTHIEIVGDGVCQLRGHRHVYRLE